MLVAYRGGLRKAFVGRRSGNAAVNPRICISHQYLNYATEPGGVVYSPMRSKFKINPGKMMTRELFRSEILNLHPMDSFL